MARVKASVLAKVKRALIEKFPPPATVKLVDHDGIIGVITSASFAGMDTIDRQDLIGRVVESRLGPEERRRVQVIIGVTPEEGTGYLASDGC